jgi:aquaporin Z
VLVKVEAISIEGGETLSRLGGELSSVPHIVGYQCGGTVVAVEDGVTRFEIGDRVVTTGLDGSHAELRVTPEGRCWKIPEALSTVEGACVPVAYGTAHDCVNEFGALKAAETVLIQAGASAVGIAAIQMASQIGARVLATASRDDKLERLAEFGLDVGINYVEKDLVSEARRLTDGRGVDLVVDTVGGVTLQASLVCLAYRGRCVSVGDAGRSGGHGLDTSVMRMSNLTLRWYFLGAELFMGTRAYAMISELLEEIAAGRLQVVIDRRFGLAEAAEAHAYIESRRAFGRVVLVPKGLALDANRARYMSTSSVNHSRSTDASYARQARAYQPKRRSASMGTENRPIAPGAEHLTKTDIEFDQRITESAHIAGLRRIFAPPWIRDFDNLSHEWRRWFSEFLGTFMLVLVAAGGGVVAARIPGGLSRPELVVAPALMVMAIILFMGAVGGAHLNPVVSIAFALRKDFPWRRVPGYLISQILGSVLACLVLWAMFGKVGHLGATLPGPGFGDVRAMIMEALLTLGLVSTILGTASGAQNVGSLSALAVAGYIALAGLWGSPVSGASMNPVRSFGPALVSGQFQHFWVYLVGPVLGMLVAVGAAVVLRGSGADAAAIRAAQGTLDPPFAAAPVGIPTEGDTNG